METSGILLGNDQTVDNLSQRSEITRDQFLTILIEQLKSQDPLDPLDNNDFLQQMTSIQSLESSTSLASNFSVLLAQNQMGAASALIGKEITGLAEGGYNIVGTVERVLIQEDGARLVVGNDTVALENVQEIRNPASPDAGIET